MQTTGDEATELAYSARGKTPGRAVGINLRVASYSKVQTDIIAKVGSVLQDFARRHQVPLRLIPIALHEFANDHLSIQRLLAGFDDESDGGLSLDAPLKVITQTARCRIVVTGAYHAAVFALAQGIPVVCLTNSPYYLAKFQGSENLFTIGCEIVILSEPDFPGKLANAIETTWNSAENVRLPLLQSSLRQIEGSRRAYQRLQDLLSCKTGQAHLVMSEGASPDKAGHKSDQCSAETFC